MRFATQFSEIERRSWRNTVRYVAVSALAAHGKFSGKAATALIRPRVHFLYLHHVFADETSHFSDLVKYLQRGHTIISHSEGVRRISNGQIDRPYVCISFDDGLKSCMAAADILETHGVSGCFYVCPSIIGETDEAKIEQFCRTRLSQPMLEFMTWDDLERLKAAGHEIGSHSMNHANLAEINGGQLVDEIGQSRELLQKQMGQARHFAWPYGTFSHFAAQARTAVFSAGYESCASAVRGSHVVRHDRPPDELCLRRDHVIAAWPVSHIKYFIAQSSWKASIRDNQWPEGLRNSV